MDWATAYVRCSRVAAGTVIILPAHRATDLRELTLLLTHHRLLPAAVVHLAAAAVVAVAVVA